MSSVPKVTTTSTELPFSLLPTKSFVPAMRTTNSENDHFTECSASRHASAGHFDTIYIQILNHVVLFFFVLFSSLMCYICASIWSFLYAICLVFIWCSFIHGFDYSDDQRERMEIAFDLLLAFQMMTFESISEEFSLRKKKQKKI